MFESDSGSKRALSGFAISKQPKGNPPNTKVEFSSNTTGKLNLTRSYIASVVRRVKSNKLLLPEENKASLTVSENVLEDFVSVDTMKAHSSVVYTSSEQKLLSIIRIASEFVDGIILESLRALELAKDRTEYESCGNLLPASCEVKKEHPSLFDLANEFVKSILDESTKRTANIHFLGIDRFQSYNNIEEFRVKDGIDVVAKCISKWSLNPYWCYETSYLGRAVSESDQHAYFYTVRLSVPTPGYPVAQVTVDINFTVKVFQMRPPPVFIEVWYRMETDRSEHNAFSSKLLEKWLHKIVKRKLQLFKRFKF